MKKVIIKNFDRFDRELDTSSIGSILHVTGDDRMEVSDGFHTFDELYDHRIALFIALCRKCNAIDGEGGIEYDHKVWRSKLHSDGSAFEGWFVMGMFKEKGVQITYHLPISEWENTEFAETLEKAPEFDGHSSADVLKRIKNI